jgi:hypothetical protein
MTLCWKEKVSCIFDYLFYSKPEETTLEESLEEVGTLLVLYITYCMYPGTCVKNDIESNSAPQNTYPLHLRWSVEKFRQLTFFK